MRHFISHSLPRCLALLLALFWLLAAPAFAADRGALFKLTLDGHTLHLFGTMHVGQPDFYPLEPRITAALAAASTLALEIDLNQPPADLMRDMRMHGLLADGAAAYAGLPPDRRRRLDALIQQAGLDPATALSLKPVLLASMLAMAEYTRLGYRSDLSSDVFLAGLARDQHIRVIGLESMAEQLTILDRLPEPARWAFLEETMDTLASGEQRAEAQAVLHAWRTADRDALDAVLRRCEADRSVSGRFFNDVLLQERNRGMAERLLALLRAEPRTVGAVGVLHLLGAAGVPALLRARGVTVERIY